MTLVFGTALVIVMISAAVIIRSLLAVKLTEPDRAMLKKYESIRVALAQDDLGLAQRSAIALVISIKRGDKLAQPRWPYRRPNRWNQLATHSA